MTHCVKHQLTSLILFCGLEDHHIHTKHKMPPPVVDTVFISDHIQHKTAHHEGGKLQHHPPHVWPVWITLFTARLCLEGQKKRTKHLAPDTGSPVTHLVDRTRDRGKDRWMENNKAEGAWGRRNGLWRMRWEGGTENKNCVFTREDRERRNASITMSHVCWQPPHSVLFPHHDQTSDNKKRIITALHNYHNSQ